MSFSWVDQLQVSSFQFMRCEETLMEAGNSRDWVSKLAIVSYSQLAELLYKSRRHK